MGGSHCGSHEMAAKHAAIAERRRAPRASLPGCDGGSSGRDESIRLPLSHARPASVPKAAAWVTRLCVCLWCG